MIPILLAVGQGLAWLVATLAYLVVWGAGVKFGFSVGDFIVSKVTTWRGKVLAKEIQKDPALRHNAVMA